MILNLLPGNCVVLLPEACRAGRASYVGMKFDEKANAFVETGEPQRVVLTGEEAWSDLQMFRKFARLGNVVSADKQTADILGVPFSEDKLNGFALFAADGAAIQRPYPW